MSDWVPGAEFQKREKRIMKRLGKLGITNPWVSVIFLALLCFVALVLISLWGPAAQKVRCEEVCRPQALEAFANDYCICLDPGGKPTVKNVGQ